MPAEDVTFHEVGAVDSIADIVLACAGLEALTIDSVIASPLVDGSGTMNCSHGRASGARSCDFGNSLGHTHPPNR